MATNIFVNLAVKDLAKSKAFFTALGFTFNAQFTDERAACLEIGHNIFAMLLTEPTFKTFTKKELCDCSTHTEGLYALQVESKEKVDAMMEKALAAGAKEPVPTQDHGWMYGRDFEDLDGHTWEVFFMDTAAMPKND